MHLRDRSPISVSITLGLVTLWGVASACSDDAQTPAGAAGTGGTGTAMAGSGNTMAGSNMTGGSGGTAAGTGGTMMSTAGTAGAGGTSDPGDPATVIPDEMCSGISNGNACSLVGTCVGRACGIADVGSRDCVCGLDSIWDCESCQFPMDFVEFPFLEPPAAGDAGVIAACDNSVADEVVCTNRGERCTIAGELCACYVEEPEDSGTFVWDCDSEPNFWP